MGTPVGSARRGTGAWGGEAAPRLRAGAAGAVALLVAGCDGQADKGAGATQGVDSAGDDTGTVTDHDADGAPASVDCDDADPAVYPGAPEVCGDGRVTDCQRVEAGWTTDLCLRVTEPILRLRRGGSSLGEI